MLHRARGERFSGLSLAVTGFDAAYNSKFALPELMLLTASFKRCECFQRYDIILPLLNL